MIGTENADQVFAIQTGTNTFHAKVNGVYTPILTATGAMVIHGLGGDDYLKTLVSTRPSRIYGGEGNDELWGFIAPDLLDGGNGNDSLYPRSGRDVVVGGDGVDRFGTIDSGDVIFHNRLATINGEDDAAKEEFRALWVSDPAGALAILDMLIVNEDDEDRERILGLPGTIFAGANDY